VSTSPVPTAIVVPLDGSQFAERALPVARAVATQFGARLELWNACADDDSRAGFDTYLRTLALTHHADRVTVVDRDDVARALAEVASDDSTLVCMSTHGRGVARSSVLGSVAVDVLRLGCHPVLLVGRHCTTELPDGLQHVLVCLDGSPGAAKIEPVATAWCRALGLSAHVVEVLCPYDLEPDRADDDVMTFADALRRGDVDVATEVLVEGSIPKALAERAADLPGAVLMMTSSLRHGVPRLVLGSIAVATVARSTAPVLVAPRP
jgi:nucleotide-binding universal stress UspA family protein